MAVPDFQSMMLPILEFFSDGKEHTVKDASLFIAKHFNLSEKELEEKISSGTKRYASNAQWVVTYFRKAKLLENSKRGVSKITERGKKLLSTKPEKIDTRLLRQYSEFVEFVTVKSENSHHSEQTIINTDDSMLTPEDVIDNSFKSIYSALTDELLIQLKNTSASFFEKIVVDVLLKMGYGGIHGSGMVVGKSGDGGIDGIIYEDKLGLESIYIQAKKWEGNVPDGEIRNFIGSLNIKGARKGIFITTSDFTKPALESAEKAQNVKIVLIDGKTLAKIMTDYNVGVSVRANYEIKRIDSDYFEE